MALAGSSCAARSQFRTALSQSDKREIDPAKIIQGFGIIAGGLGRQQAQGVIGAAGIEEFPGTGGGMRCRRHAQHESQQQEGRHEAKEESAERKKLVGADSGSR